MGQDRKVSLAPVGKKDVIAEGDGAVAAEPEHDAAE
jgi:hypothetical protein